MIETMDSIARSENYQETLVLTKLHVMLKFAKLDFAGQ